MTIHFDDKGKFYTDIISKEPVQSTIQTITERINGNIYIRQGERLIDELKASEQFIAVTNATVYNPRGEVLYHADFVTINRHHIIWIIPHEEVDNEPSTSGSQL